MRFRKDLGDLADLKKSIKKHGLIHPIVVDSQGNLIAGERRRQACKELGIEPEVRVVDFDKPQLAEIDENTCRKDFTPREIYEISQYYHKLYSRQGKRQSSDNGTNGNGDFVRIPNEVTKPIKTVAKIVGKSVDTISKLNQIYESPYNQVKFDLDLDKISIDEAYQCVKRGKERDEEKERQREMERERERWRIANPDFFYRKAQEKYRRYEEEHQKKSEKEMLSLALEIIDRGYKSAAAIRHPDKGGSNEGMVELTGLKNKMSSFMKAHIGKVVNLNE